MTVVVRVCHQEPGEERRGELQCSAARCGVVGGRATPSTSALHHHLHQSRARRRAAAALMNVAVFIAGAIHGFLVPHLVMRLDTYD